LILSLAGRGDREGTIEKEAESDSAPRAFSGVEVSCVEKDPGSLGYARDDTKIGNRARQSVRRGGQLRRKRSPTLTLSRRTGEGTALHCFLLNSCGCFHTTAAISKRHRILNRARTDRALNLVPHLHPLPSGRGEDRHLERDLSPGPSPFRRGEHYETGLGGRGLHTAIQGSSEAGAQPTLG
jgi:hypothetical protein